MSDDHSIPPKRARFACAARRWFRKMGRICYSSHLVDVLPWVFETPNVNDLCIAVFQTFHPLIGVGADKFVGVRRIFAQISPNLPKKFLCAFCPYIFSHKEDEGLFLVWPPKKVLIVFFCKRWAPFFEVKQCWAPFFLDFQGFYPDFQRFCPNFQGFCPNFQQIKTFGGALVPPAVPPPTPLHPLRTFLLE